MNRPISLALLVVLLPLAGCLPRTTVRKNPGPRDKGVRYYRPKPYLLIKPMVNNDQMPVDGYVTMETVMMPDFGEEYSIHVRSGLGTNATQIQLADGWNLTSLNVDLDSQFDENLRAVADVMRSLPIPTEDAFGSESRMVIRATNVPLGLYEAVVSTGSDCKKRLYGFRYVGFMPYANCPLDSSGRECRDCAAGELYGLVFEDGAMVFRLLHEVPCHIDLQRLKIDPQHSPGEPTENGSAGGNSADGSLIMEDDEALPLDAPSLNALPAPSPSHVHDHQP